MTNDEFEALLKRAGLTKKRFSTIVGMNYNSVTNWHKSGKVPNWVRSWLMLYIEKAECAELKAIIKRAVCN